LRRSKERQPPTGAVDAFNGKDLTEKKGMVVVGEEEGSWKF
jgi:hypothetical protein